MALWHRDDRTSKERCRDRSRPNTPASYQLGSRNSKAYWRFLLSSLRNEASRSRFTLNCGGSWNKIGPTLGSRALSRVSINSKLLRHFSVNRFQCVINFEAFQAKTEILGRLVAPSLHRFD